MALRRSGSPNRRSASVSPVTSAVGSGAGAGAEVAVGSGVGAAVTGGGDTTMATIKEVADYAGVSVATVSRVINKTGYVSLDLQGYRRGSLNEIAFKAPASANA